MDPSRSRKISRVAAKKKASKKPRNTPPPDKIDRQPVHASSKLAGLSAMTRTQKLQKLSAVRNKLNTKYKSQVLVAGDEASTNSWLRRPCGIMQIDIDTGGGLPAASLNTIGGPNNSGKTTLMYHYFAMHQRLYGEDSFIALANSEGNIDYLQARRAGWIIPVPKKVIEAEQESRSRRGLTRMPKEEVAELRRGIGTLEMVNAVTAETILDVTEGLLKDNIFGLIGIDSYEGLMPKAEAELDSLEEYAQQAARASLITRFLQHWGPIRRDSRHWTTLIMTMQVRSNRKKAEAASYQQKYIKDWSDEAASNALKHWRTNHIIMYGGAKVKEGSGDKVRVVGKEVHWEIAKGKEGSHDNVLGCTNYYYDPRCFNTMHALFITGIKYGVIQERKGKLTLVHQDGTSDDFLCDVPSPEEFVNAIGQDLELELSLRREIAATAGVTSVYY
jgi:RecA/RadA recombinase